MFGHNSVLQRSPENQDQHTTPMALVKYLPTISSGIMLITTRDKRVGERIVNRAPNAIVDVLPFNPSDARQLLHNKSPQSVTWDPTQTQDLLEILNYLPLAIAHAAAYISEQGVDLGYYLDLLRPGNVDTKDLLEEPYYDPGRDLEIQNSILLTLTLSFEQIKRQKPRAAEILSLMAILDRQAVADTLLRGANERKVGFDTAIGTLKAFSLIAASGEGQHAFQMHRLVQIATQRWLENERTMPEWQEKALDAVLRCCPPTGRYEHWAAWETINPHVQTVPAYQFSPRTALMQRARLRARLLHLSQSTIHIRGD